MKLKTFQFKLIVIRWITAFWIDQWNHFQWMLWVDSLVYCTDIWANSANILGNMFSHYTWLSVYNQFGKWYIYITLHWRLSSLLSNALNSYTSAGEIDFKIQHSFAIWRWWKCWFHIIFFLKYLRHKWDLHMVMLIENCHFPKCEQK